MYDASNDHFYPRYRRTRRSSSRQLFFSADGVHCSIGHMPMALRATPVKMRFKNSRLHRQGSGDSSQSTLTRRKFQPFSQLLQRSIKEFTKACQLQKAKPHILNLPQELLDEIVGYLPVLSQASLAICCRSFYIRFQQVLQHPNLQYPRHLFRDNQPYIKRDVEKGDHAKLLCYLETSYWKHCPSCAKLHPHSAWRRPRRQRSYQLNFSSGQKPRPEITTSSGTVSARVHHESKPSLDCLDPPPSSSFQASNREKCLPWAGLADICPCLSMTYHHRDQIKQLLKSMETKMHTGTEFYFENQFYHIGSGNPFLFHECVRKNDIVTAEIRTVFYMLQGYLIVTNIYHVCVTGEKLPVDVEPPFSSSQREKLRWFFRFMRFLNEPEVWSESKPRSKSNGFGIRTKRVKEVPRGTKEFMVSIKRNLGGGRTKDEWPDRNWEECCIARRERE